MMRPCRAPSRFTWAKVVLAVVLIDVLLFHYGLFWRLTPRFGHGARADEWVQLYGPLRDVETLPVAAGTAVIAGSSVVLMGVDDGSANRLLQRDDVPAHLVRLAGFGWSCTDVALIAAQALRLRPWLLIYGVAARDFAKSGPTDDAVIRTLYDSSVDLPLLPRRTLEARLDATARRYWKLYGYRSCVRAALLARGAELLDRLPLVPPARADASLDAAEQGELLQRFDPHWTSPDAFRMWEQWRRSRRFEDYLEWMRTRWEPLEVYKQVTLANYGPQENPQVASLRWMLARARQAGVRVVLAYFPQNPVFKAPEGRVYFDAALSDAYAEVFAGEAAAQGARFVDLRDFLPPEDFYDFSHPNLEGQRVLTERIAALVAEEWAQRGGSGK